MLFQSSHFHKHGTAAGIGLSALIVLGMSSVGPASLTGNVIGDVADIGIEHNEPLSLFLEIGVLDDMAAIEFFSESSETILISVPSAWVRREVKNAPIHTVTSEPPSLGFTRWTLPPRAGISFKTADAPDSIVLHNPSKVQMKLQFAHVDLATETVEKDVLLIQGDTVRLW